MEGFRRLFNYPKLNIIGMIHLKPLPGTPKSNLDVSRISEKACNEAEVYAKYAVDGVIIENMHDTPYTKTIGPEIIASMSRICRDVRQTLPSNIPSGIQVLAGGNVEAVAIAKATDLQFVRCEGFVFGHIGDEGYIESCAGPLLRYRKNIDAADVQIYCDIKKKHSAHAITSDVTITETAKAAEFFLADGMIVTGSATGNPADPSELNDVLSHTALPVLVGSGVSCENLESYINAHGLIIGSYFKKHGRWENEIDEDRLARFMDRVNDLRSKAVEI